MTKGTHLYVPYSFKRMVERIRIEKNLNSNMEAINRIQERIESLDMWMKLYEGKKKR